MLKPSVAKTAINLRKEILPSALIAVSVETLVPGQKDYEVINVRRYEFLQATPEMGLDVKSKDAPALLPRHLCG
jgi:hypothetical protein